MRIPLHEVYDEVEVGPLYLNQSFEEAVRAVHSLEYYLLHNLSIHDESLYWDDLEVQNHEYDLDNEHDSAIKALHILNLYVLPCFIALALLLNALQFTITARRNMKRYHHSLIYYLALSVISIVSLVLFSIQIHFIPTYALNLSSDFACKLLHFINHITAHSYGYVFSVILIERTLVTAYMYRQVFESVSTNSIKAAKRAIGSDWLNRITRGFSSQWATTLTISLIFLGTALNHVWVWWSYEMHYSGEFGWCTSISPIHSAWQFSFMFGIVILQIVCIIICNICLFIYKFKMRKTLKKNQLDENGDRLKVDEGPPAGKRPAEDFNCTVQESYKTEISEKIQNKNNNNKKIIGGPDIDLSQTETIDVASSRQEVSWVSFGEARSENAISSDFVAAWKTDDEKVEITTTQTPNSSSASQNDVRNYAHDFLDPADDLKQDSLTIAAQCITLSLVITRLPNVLMKVIWLFEHSDKGIAYIVIITGVGQFLFILDIIAMPTLLFLFLRPIILREARVMWGEIQEFWQRARSRFWRPNLFDDSAQGSSAHTVEGERILNDV